MESGWQRVRAVDGMVKGPRMSNERWGAGCSAVINFYSIPNGAEGGQKNVRKRKT